MRNQQRGGVYDKYEVKAPPSFVNFYKRMESNQEMHRQTQNRMNQINTAPQSRYTSSNASGLAKYQRTIEPQRSQAFDLKDTKLTTVKSSKAKPVKSYAPSSQYRMYLNNTQNVFYQQRSQAGFLKNIQMVRPILNYTITILFIFWAILFFITPHQGKCPDNADCGVFVHCHEGFTLKNGYCHVSQYTKNKAVSICEAAIQNLKYDYGSQDCQGGQYTQVPLKTIGQIFDEYQVDNTATENQIKDWFYDAENQDKHKFQFVNTRIIPLQKKYTVFCKFQKVSQSKWFIPSAIITVLSLIGIMILLRVYKQKRRAIKIYESLKKRVKQEKDVIIKREELQKNYGAIYGALWQQIDKSRVEDECIAYYEDQNLHWTFIE